MVMAVVAARRKQEASTSWSAWRVNELNVQINRRGRIKIIRDAVGTSGDTSRLRRCVIRCTRERACKPTTWVCACCTIANRSRRTDRCGNSFLWPPESGQATLTPLRSVSTWYCLVVFDNDTIYELDYENDHTAFCLPRLPLRFLRLSLPSPS